MIRRIGNGYINATNIEIGENVTWGNDVAIDVRGSFRVGDNSHIGDRFTVTAEQVSIGSDFCYFPTDRTSMIVGGGGAKFPHAILKMGDRCVCHAGHINLARPVAIGDDVGLSYGVDIITHGFWANPLDGFPMKTQAVTIGNNVIVGWKSMIMPGVHISDDTVIGAGSVVTKSILRHNTVYAGVPARQISKITEPTNYSQNHMMDSIVHDWNSMLEQYYDVDNYHVTRDGNIVICDGLSLNLKTRECSGKHSEVTDAFRDFLRRYGIRIFHERGFSFNLPRSVS